MPIAVPCGTSTEIRMHRFEAMPFCPAKSVCWGLNLVPKYLLLATLKMEKGMRRLVSYSGLILVILSIAHQPSALAQTQIVPSNVIQSCESCHGPGGNSTISSTPRLNGQRAEYLFSRLETLADPTNESPHASPDMSEVLKNIDNQKRHELAWYYSTQPPMTSDPGPLSTLGAAIYSYGRKSRSIPACSGCHGQNGEGAEAGPRLAGQHRNYLKIQLLIMNAGLRRNKIMHPIAMNLRGMDIEEVISYLGRD